MTLRRTLASAAVTAVFLVAAAGCSSSDSDGPAPDAEVGDAVTVVSTTEAPATTEAPVATTLPPPVGRPTGEEAARTLYDAWTNDDRDTAATVAEPEAIDVIWSATPGPYELYRNCDDGDFDTGGCLFRDRSTNNTIQINLEKYEDQWVVTGAFFSEG